MVGRFSLYQGILWSQCTNNSGLSVFDMLNPYMSNILKEYRFSIWMGRLYKYTIAIIIYIEMILFKTCTYIVLNVITVSTGFHTIPILDVSLGWG